MWIFCIKCSFVPENDSSCQTSFFSEYRRYNPEYTQSFQRRKFSGRPVRVEGDLCAHILSRFSRNISHHFTGVPVMKKSKAVWNVFRKSEPVRAGTGKWVAMLAAIGLVFGNFVLPANAEEPAEGLRGYAAGEIAVSGTDESSITQSAEKNGVHVRKTLKNNGDGTLQIELESWVSGRTRTEPLPADVILVMDTSGSMRLPCEGAADRLEALKNAACAFVDSVQAQNEGVAADRQSRIALIQYSSAANTGIRRHLICADEEGAGQLRSIIRSMEKGGRTRTDLGMELAEEVMREADSGRSRAVVLFTDGVPANEDYDGFVTVTANRTLASARRLKESGVEVFGLSIEQYASCRPGEALPSYTPHSDANYIAPYYGIDGVNTSNENAIALENRFMYLVTSDNPHAQDLDTPNALDSSDPGRTRGEQRETYYFTAQSSSELTGVFQNLAQQVGTSDRALGAGTQARDEILEPFHMADGGQVLAYTSDYLGDGSWGERRDITSQMTIQATGRSVRAEGFDYAASYVSEDPHPETGQGQEAFRGRKLILSFPIVPQAIFGGNHLPTNSSTSGIYQDAAAEEAEVCYPVPYADLAIRCRVGMKDQRVYVPDSVDLAELVSRPEAFLADGKRNGWVDIRYELRDPEGNLAGTLEIPAGKSEEDCSWQWGTNTAESCGTYHLECRVSPVSEGHFDTRTLTAEGTVHVFHPEVTLQDSVQYLGDEPDTLPGDTTDGGSLGEHLVSLRWICPDGTGSRPEEEPPLCYRIAILQGVEQKEGRWIITQKPEIPVVVGVYRQKDGKADGDITDRTEYLHQCGRANCRYDADRDGKRGVRYLIHVLEKPMQEKVVLPNTGGTGTKGYYAAAVLAGGIAVILWIRKKKRFFPVNR